MSENLVKEYTLSSRKRRIAAFIIDHFVFTFLIVGTVFLSLGTDFRDENNLSNLISKMLPTMLIGFLVYFAKDSIRGISPGKWIMGIMVRNENNPNEVPALGKLFTRNLFLIIWPVEFIVLASNQEKKRLGDKIAKAIVVKNPTKAKSLPRILALVGIGIAFFTFTFLFAGSAMKNSDAYKVAVSEIEQNEEIISETGGIIGYGMMPIGNVSISNGNGQAQLEIKVLGNKKDMNVGVYLTKEPNGEWKLIELNK
ncbi:putative RDD family membrane protein YckC [Mariniflexile fucanivorans]|uniref:Putative RDD family membrane protein YckC n=1 Tax=Mariniflexile fucanivorans TaxID=264023 RepID=A0A4R1RMZ1_9FLAO|nr:RDD family protein [Mariniflexile fucanivorans]TCL67574.1 putative RDD family membrane protein YckC [Mariniflexile fucanivorans]